jgi:hypothetical protein
MDHVKIIQLITEKREHIIKECDRRVRELFAIIAPTIIASIEKNKKCIFEFKYYWDPWRIECMGKIINMNVPNYNSIGTHIYDMFENTIVASKLTKSRLIRTAKDDYILVKYEGNIVEDLI